MSILETYEGLQIVTPAPTGLGGLALNTNFASIADALSSNATSLAEKLDKTGGTMTGSLFFSGGSVGIGTTSPSSALDIYASATQTFSGLTTSTGATKQAQADWTASWSTSTNASRKARLVGKIYDTASRQWIQVDTNGSSPSVAFAGAVSTGALTASSAAVSGTLTVDTVASSGTSISISADLEFGGGAIVQGIFSLLAENITIDSDAVIRHLVGSVGQGSAPTISPDAGAGTSPTISIEGTDTAGRITLTTGTSPAASVVAFVSFDSAYSTIPYILLTPGNGNAAARSGTGAVWIDSFDDGFDIVVGSTALTASTLYIWNYHVIS